MKCPRCQQENPSHAKFCLACGAPVDEATPSPKSYADLKDENEELRRSLGDAHTQVTDALEHQTATSEILRVIASSPIELEPVFNTIARAAARLCEAFDVIVLRVDGDILRLVAHHGPMPAADVPFTAERSVVAP